MIRPAKDAETVGLRIAERIRQEMTSGRQWWLDALSPDQRVEFEGDLASTCVAICEDEFAASEPPAPVGSACTASPDHADIMATIEDAAANWQELGYTSALAEVRDMANVGRALMAALPEGYAYNDCPSEIVSDLQNERDDALAVPAPVGSVDGERLRAKRGHIATRSVVLAEIRRLTVLSDARAVPLADAITRALVTPSSDPIAGARDTLERAAKACEAVRDGFLLPEYATPQPIGSITERFACDQCAAAIRALTGSEPSADAIAGTGKGGPA